MRGGKKKGRPRESDRDVPFPSQFSRYQRKERKKESCSNVHSPFDDAPVTSGRRSAPKTPILFSPTSRCTSCGIDGRRRPSSESQLTSSHHEEKPWQTHPHTSLLCFTPVVRPLPRAKGHATHAGQSSRGEEGKDRPLAGDDGWRRSVVSSDVARAPRPSLSLSPFVPARGHRVTTKRTPERLTEWNERENPCARLACL